MSTETIAQDATVIADFASVLLIATQDMRASVISNGLPSTIHIERVIEADASGLSQAAAASDADLVIIDCPAPSQDLFSGLAAAFEVRPRPVILFTEDADAAFAGLAVESGVSCYVVDGLSPDRIIPLIGLARERFRQTRSLQDEVRKLKADLEARKIIERAKGVLMARRSLDEAEAFDAMRRLAMAQGRPLRDIASYVLVIANTLDDPTADAFEMMRSVAASQDKSVVDIANDIVAVSDLLGEGSRRKP